jgi:hypothetical protein
MGNASGSAKIPAALENLVRRAMAGGAERGARELA